MDYEEKTINEKASYIKGLAEGMGLGDTPEAKIIKALIDLVDDMSVVISDLEDEVDMIEANIEDMDEDMYEMGEQLDAVDEDLGELEDFIYDLDYGFSEYDDSDDDFADSYDITCPSCGEEFSVDEETLLDGSVNCPKCNELLTFDFDEDDEADGED